MPRRLQEPTVSGLPRFGAARARSSATDQEAVESHGTDTFLRFAFGFAWLATLIGAEKAFAFGVAPFWAATLLKTALAVAVLPPAWALMRRVRG